MPDLLVPAWPAPSNVRAVMTTRAGGSSTGAWRGLNLGLNSGDERATVHANRSALQAAVGVDPSWLQQVHGVQVVHACGDETGEPVADASFTDTPGVACAILVADCMPVLFCDRGGSRVAAAHAGWRGLAAGVLEATLEASGLEPASTLAWIGPAIGPDRFEVGDDVRDAFSDESFAGAFRAHAPGKWMADLPRLAALRLAAAGVTAIYPSGLCTASDPERFYSYRRDGVTGRMAALIWRV